MDSKRKQTEEKHLISKMIHLYCCNKHAQKHKSLCDECRNLLNYAYDRIDNCPVIKTKSFCSSCAHNCYNNERRIQIKRVMRFSGKRMLFHNPIVTIKHLIKTLEYKIKKR